MSQGLTHRFRFASALSSRRLSPPGLRFISSARASLGKPFSPFGPTVFRAPRPAPPLPDSRSFIQAASLLWLLPDTLSQPRFRPDQPRRFPLSRPSTPSRFPEISSGDFAFLRAFTLRTHRAFALKLRFRFAPTRFSVPRAVGSLFARLALFPHRCGFFRFSRFALPLQPRFRSAAYLFGPPCLLLQCVPFPDDLLFSHRQAPSEPLLFRFGSTISSLRGLPFGVRYAFPSASIALTHADGLLSQASACYSLPLSSMPRPFGRHTPRAFASSLSSAPSRFHAFFTLRCLPRLSRFALFLQPRFRSAAYPSARPAFYLSPFLLPSVLFFPMSGTSQTSALASA